jgi:VWFA-related protein
MSIYRRYKAFLRCSSAAPAEGGYSSSRRRGLASQEATVSAWRVSLEERGLGSSSIIIRMSAIRKLAAEARAPGVIALLRGGGRQRREPACLVEIESLHRQRIRETASRFGAYGNTMQRVTSRSALFAASIAILAGQSPTFHVSTRLIQVSVIVRDHKGNPVTGLTREQFAVFDQGAAQKIVFFAEQSSASKPSNPPAPPATGNVFSNRAPDGSAQTAAGSVTTILFDSLNTDFLDTGFARERVKKFLKGIQPEDRVALYGLSTKLSVLHDFTGDADALALALDRFKASENPETSASKFKESNLGDPTVDAMTNDMNQRRADVFMRGRVQATAAALEAIAKHLAGMPGRKNLVWVSGSFPLNFGYFQKRLPGTRPTKAAFGDEVEEAARALSSANVAIYPVDAHALTTLEGVFNAATAPRMGAAGLLISNRRPDLEPIGDIGTMQALAEATGGRAFKDANDIEGAVRSAVDDSRCSYVLSYYPDHNKWDGKFREIKVQVKHSGVETRYRRGYLAFADDPKDQNRGPLTAADALATPLESTELGLTMRIEAAGDRLIKAHLTIDASAIRFEEQNGRWTGALDYLWVQLARDGAMVLSHEQTLNFKLSPETYRKAMADGLKMSFDETLAAQTVELRFLARDRGTGEQGSLKIPLGTVSR